MCTLNAAVSLGRAHDRGSLEPGKRADIVIWKVPEHGLVINRFGVNLVDRVLVAGEVAVAGGRVTRPSAQFLQSSETTLKRATMSE